VLRGSRVQIVSRNGTGVLMEAGEPICTGAVVDATGRAARIARSLGAKREQLDRLVCAARVFATGTQPAGDTFIEAEPNGWWYASPLPEGRRLIALFTDAQHAVEARVATVDGWAASLAGTDHVRQLAHGSPHGQVHVVGCASHELRPVAGPDWIAIGDSALAVDPLSSGGVVFALRCAAAAANVLLGGDRSAYQDFVAIAAREYRQIRTQIYGWEYRFADNDFWRSRAG
jgi:flavin-dependent dehydrogenase